MSGTVGFCLRLVRTLSSDASRGYPSVNEKGSVHPMR